MIFEKAIELLKQRESHVVSGCPLRFRPCLVQGPTDGFVVTTLGEAWKAELQVLSLGFRPWHERECVAGKESK